MTTNKIYQTPETAIVFKESGGDVSFIPKGTATNTGHYSAQCDRGAGAKAMRYRWEATTKFAVGLAIGAVVRIYIATAHSASASIDGGLGTGDTATTVETQFNNLKLIGQIVADAATVGPFYASGVVTILARYVTVGWWNASGQAYTNTAGDHIFTLIPIPDDVQAAA